MLKFCSLYSGSSGNCLLVQSDKTKILIDAGVSCRRITNALASLGVDITEIDAILITHEHSDHVSSLPVLSKKFNIPIYTTVKTWDVIIGTITGKHKYHSYVGADDPVRPGSAYPSSIHFFNIGKEFEIGDLKIKPFEIPHDAIEPCGFNIFNHDTKISIATDIGHMNSTLIKHLKNSSFVFLEANHDPAIVKYCNYPYFLKKRILSKHGHLCNDIAGQTISELSKHGLKHVMLGHLSKENNFPELAYNTVTEVLSLNNINLNSINLSVASRTEPSEFIEVS